MCLWGGLLLFHRLSLPLLLANRWAYNTSAILSDLGLACLSMKFGKFITKSNDYFYPPAAPIIYAFFLLTVFLFLQSPAAERTAQGPSLPYSGRPDGSA